MRELPKFERNCISGQKSMEERLPHLLVRILIVSGCVVERAKQFLAALLMFASIRQFGDESAHCIVVSNSELVRMSSHDRTSVSEDYTVQGSLPAGTAWVFVNCWTTRRVRRKALRGEGARADPRRSGTKKERAERRR